MWSSEECSVQCLICWLCFVDEGEDEMWDGRELLVWLFSEMEKEREAISLVGLNMWYDWL